MDDPPLPHTPSAPPAVAETPSPLSEQLTTISARLNELRDEFVSKLKYDAIKDRQIDMLHSEVQAQREGLHWRLLRPMFTDLITIYDDITTTLEHHAANASETSAGGITPKTLDTVRGAILEALSRNGVETFTTPGDSYSVETQRAVATVPTTDVAQNGAIARRVRVGFRYETRIIRPEWVAVFQTLPGAP